MNPKLAQIATLSATARGRLDQHAPLLARIRAATRALQPPEQPWYHIEDAAKPAEATIWLYDDVFFGAADEFVRDVAGLSASTINLHLNTPGGYVFDGIAIHNALISHPATVNVVVDGVAASIGSVIAMAGDTVTMGRGTSMMIHNAAGVVMGEAVDMREMADLLDQLGGDIAGFYAARAGGSIEQWLAAMTETTWYSAHKAVEVGLADAVLGDEAAPAARVRPAEGDDNTDGNVSLSAQAAERSKRSRAAVARVRDLRRGH